MEGDTSDDLVAAAKLGGRLDCISLLRRHGVFVLEHERLHIQITRGESRLPPRAHVVAHWRDTIADRDHLEADLVEALVQACLCQTPRAAIATLDSAWHERLINEDDVAKIFLRLPRRYRPLRKLLDRRAESGPETFVRLMLRALGCRIEVQPRVAGVGRVDFIVDGWLIVECDSKAYHGSWADQLRDRRRDAAAAAAGYATLRLVAQDILYRQESVLTCLRGLVRSARRARRTSPPHPGQ